MTPREAARFIREGCTNRAVRDLALQAVGHPEARIKRTKTGLRLMGPNGTANVHMTISDKRGVLNMRAQMRRAGILA